MRDSFELERFVRAQEPDYEQALAQIRSGRKRSHWMWYVFPQFAGLGASPTSEHYAIKSLDEAKAYLAHPVLGARLIECGDAVLTVHGRSAAQIFAQPQPLPDRQVIRVNDHERRRLGRDARRRARLPLGALGKLPEGGTGAARAHDDHPRADRKCDLDREARRLAPWSFRGVPPKSALADLGGASPESICGRPPACKRWRSVRIGSLAIICPV